MAKGYLKIKSFPHAGSIVLPVGNTRLNQQGVTELECIVVHSVTVPAQPNGIRKIWITREDI